jgi:hypothetical protein
MYGGPQGDPELDRFDRFCMWRYNRQHKAAWAEGRALAYALGEVEA